MPGDTEELLPFYKQLTPAQQRRLDAVSGRRHYKPGQVLFTGAEHCLGLLVVIQGQLRVSTQSEEGREITLYRLFERDMCLFSASCILRGVTFSLRIEAQEDTEVLHIPPDEYQRLMQESPAAANYTNEVMATRFSDVMWLLEQTLYKKMDARLAAFLVEESRLLDSAVLPLTHEAIARHLGSAREVITRLLKYFQSEGLVRLSRGAVELTAPERLAALAAGSLR